MAKCYTILEVLGINIKHYKLLSGSQRAQIPFLGKLTQERIKEDLFASVFQSFSRCFVAEQWVDLEFFSSLCKLL